ncbi:MAG: serine/threonine protein kinase [Nitrospiria bacterium]
MKKVGTGGMAELFLARQIGVMGFERIVAIKRILPHLTENTEFVEMFINEAKLAAQITHPNVVQVYDFGVVEGTYFIAMEYIMGKSLSEILVKGIKTRLPVPGGLAVYFSKKIASGLDNAFRGATISGKPLGIIHRDISPQNILIGYNGEVKLVDFGIAKAASSNHHTRTGTLKGKLSYLSPEQAWGKPVDQRSDLFSLGIVLHEMLTERRLFKGENEISTIEKVRTAVIPAPSSIKPFLPKILDEIVLKALARQPSGRFQNGGDFEEHLEHYLQTLSVAPTAKDISSYLRSLYQSEIETDLSEFEQVTRIQPKILVNTSVIGIKEPVQKSLHITQPGQEAGKSIPFFKIGIGILSVIVALLVSGIIFRVRNDSMPASVEGPTVIQSPAPAESIPAAVPSQNSSSPQPVTPKAVESSQAPSEPFVSQPRDAQLPEDQTEIHRQISDKPNMKRKFREMARRKALERFLKRRNARE